LHFHWRTPLPMAHDRYRDAQSVIRTDDPI
jgi:hypothetical protein